LNYAFLFFAGGCRAFSGGGGAILSAWRGTWERVAGLLRARGWVFWTRVAGKVLIYSQISTSFPLPEPGEDARHFIDYQTVGRHANKCEKPRTKSSLLLFRVEKPNFVTG